MRRSRAGSITRGNSCITFHIHVGVQNILQHSNLSRFEEHPRAAKAVHVLGHIESKSAQGVHPTKNMRTAQACGRTKLVSKCFRHTRHVQERRDQHFFRFIREQLVGHSRRARKCLLELAVLDPEWQSNLQHLARLQNTQ